MSRLNPPDPVTTTDTTILMKTSNYLVKFAICCASFFLFVFSFHINEFFDRYALYAPGINMIFIPAGFKLLCILVGGEAAVLGLLLSSVYMSFGVWENTSLLQMVYFAFASVGSYYVAVRLIKKFMHINDTLNNLRYVHIIILSVVASVLNGTIHNIVYVWLDKVNADDFLAHSAAMIFGDFLGCFIVIMFFNLGIELAFRLSKRDRRDEEKGIRFIAHVLNRTPL